MNTIFVQILETQHFRYFFSAQKEGKSKNKENDGNSNNNMFFVQDFFKRVNMSLVFDYLGAIKILVLFTGIFLFLLLLLLDLSQSFVRRSRHSDL